MNSPGPIRQPILDVRPQRKNMLAAKETSRLAVLQSLGHWSCQFAGMVMIDQFSQPFDSRSPLVCAENHYFSSISKVKTGPFMDPTQLASDITKYCTSRQTDTETQDMSDKVEEAVKSSLLHNAAYLYGRIAFVDSMADIMRYGTPLPADDPALVFEG